MAGNTSQLAEANIAALKKALASVPTTVTGSINIQANGLSNILATTAAINSLVAATQKAGAAGVSAAGTAAKGKLAFAKGGKVPGTGSGDTQPVNAVFPACRNPNDHPPATAP